MHPNLLLPKVKDKIFVIVPNYSPFGSHPKGLFLFPLLKLKIMKIVYKILNIINPKNIFGLIQNQKSNFSLQKGKLYSDETNSLLAHMYSAENENLFI